LTQSDFAGLETTVERRVRNGEPLERVEEFIQRQRVSDEMKAALWLVAWSMEEEPELARSRFGPAAELEVVHD
jgi:hypothetical protein